MNNYETPNLFHTFFLKDGLRPYDTNKEKGCQK